MEKRCILLPVFIKPYSEDLCNKDCDFLDFNIDFDYTDGYCILFRKELKHKDYEVRQEIGGEVEIDYFGRCSECITAYNGV